MKYKSIFFVTIIVIMVFGQSCTIQKCHYSRGFAVSLKNSARGLQSLDNSENHSECTNILEAPKKEMVGMAWNEPVISDISKSSLSSSSHSDNMQKEAIFSKDIRAACVTEQNTVTTSSKIDARAHLKKGIEKLSEVKRHPLVPDWLIMLLCILIPPIAVALMTNGNIEKTLIALLLWILGVLPGIVYAFLVFLHFL